MDLVCTNCGEPWDMEYVFHEAPRSDFKTVGDSGAIIACPNCKGKKVDMPAKERERLEEAQLVVELLGDDVDGAAAMLEDFGMV